MEIGSDLCNLMAAVVVLLSVVIPTTTWYCCHVQLEVGVV